MSYLLVDVAFKSVLTGFFLVALAACGGGSGNGKSNPADNTLNQNSGITSISGDWQPNGTILFEQAYDYGYHAPLGIVAYDLAADKMTLIAEGIEPRRQSRGTMTAYLQECADIPEEGGAFYRAVVADDLGIITPITICSSDMDNPTTGVFLLDDLTEFSEVSISPDESLITVTANYDILSETQSSVIGETWNTLIYDLAGNLVTEIENAYHATWLPNGRLLLVYGNHFYLTDSELKNPTLIDDGGVLQAPVRNPAVHPSGDYFLFEYNKQIWRMNMDGRGAERLLTDSQVLRFPAWSPDGNSFVFTVWRSGSASVLQSLFFVDIVNDPSTRIDIGHVLDPSGEPWGPLSWLESRE